MENKSENPRMSSTGVLPERTHPPLRNIRLLPGSPFYDRQKDMLEFLADQDTDSMLCNFRKAAGLPAGTAKPMTGWDSWECKLRGHTTGHYLSGISLAYAATGDEVFRDKASAIVEGLSECQKAFTASGKVHPGFLSAYDEEQFDLLEELTPYPGIWAPYYTLDKIMIGLLDSYKLAGITQAAEILDPLGDWIYERLSRLSHEQRARMWDTYIAGEYGAMNSTLVRLYRISGKKEHLEAARMFENARLFDQMRGNRDELDSMHANQHIPQVTGAMEIYAVTGDRGYFDLARNFFRTVTEHHCYCIGGTGEEERFRAADSECGFLTEKTAESCASLNMLRLTSKLMEYEPAVRCDLMDYYEHTLFNHILMSCSHCADGGTTYFMPLAPGSCKHYETEENSCCHGTGMESRFRFMKDIFSYEGSGNEAVVRVNLPVSSFVDDEEKLTVSFTENGRLEVKAGADMKKKLAVRIPAWAREDFPEAADGYVYCGRLKEGESVAFDLPMKLRRIPAASDSRYYNLAWGPYLLAALSDDTDFIHPDVSELTENTDTDMGSFTDGRICCVPLYRVDREHYHIYYR